MEEYIQSMEILEVESSPENLSLRINGSDAAVMNAIRRTIVSDTPTMAIDLVWIRENTSVMPDEMIAHRLGLVPVLADPQVYADRPSPQKKEERDNLKAESPFPREYSEGNSIRMELKGENTQSHTVSVYSDDIKVEGNRAQVKKGILITRLAPQQKLECKMLGLKGTGREHAKWMPVVVCHYRQIQRLRIQDKRMLPSLRAYFRGGLIQDKSTGQFDIDENRLLVNPDLITHHPDTVRAENVPGSFIFSLETVSESEPPKSLFRRGLSMLQDKLASLEAEIPE